MLKLRHTDFGSSAGTCWRMLFSLALFPWFRKYRNVEDSLDLSNFKFAANRMWTGRLPDEASSLNGESGAIRTLEQDGVPTSGEAKDDVNEAKKIIEELEQRNKRLMKENEMMRSLLYPQGSVKKITNSCPPKIFST